MLRKISQIVLLFLLVLMIVEIVILSPQRIGRSPEVIDPSLDLSELYQNESVQQQMEGIHVVETKNDEKEWELWADKAIGFKKKGDLSITEVKTIFFGANEADFTVTGKEGSVNTETKDMRVEGGVVTRSANGYIFKTNGVIYNSEARSLKSTSDVEVTGPADGTGQRLRIKGKTMSASLEESNMNISENVTATKPVRDEKLMRIRSKEVELSGADKSVKFSGSVTIDIEGLRVTGPDALFKYDKKSDILKEIELSGGVRVSDVDKWATSEKVRIFLLEDRYVFTGGPRIVQNDDELRGDQIIFLNGGKQVEVKNARVKVGKEQIERLQ